jgi:CubicO group peptidase (beta-lactamase class C family)
MTSAGYRWPPTSTLDVAIPHDEQGRAYPWYQLVEHGSGGSGSSSVEDLARFVAAAMPGPNGEPAGRGIIAPHNVERMLRAAPETGGTYGLGYQLAPLKKGGSFASHQGSMEGFRTLFLIDLDKRAAIVLLTNSDLGGRVMGQVVCAWAEWVGIELSEACPETKP